MNKLLTSMFALAVASVTAFSAHAQEIKGDAKAAAAYSASFGKDPSFAQFYRSLDAYKASFGSKGDVMVLDPASSEFFKGMRGSSGATPAKK